MASSKPAAFVARFAGPLSWGVRRLRSRTLLGTLIYAVDRAIGPERHMLQQLSFIFRELREHGYKQKDLVAALYGLRRRVQAIRPIEFLQEEDRLLEEACAWREYAKAQAERFSLGVPLQA